MATPTGISHGNWSLSAACPNSGWMSEDPTVAANSSAPAAEYEYPR
jgi:hypothetical protein